MARLQSSCLKAIACAALAIVLLFPVVMTVVPVAGQNTSQIPVGSRLAVAVEYELFSEATDDQGSQRIFYSASGTVDVFQKESPTALDSGSLELRGLGSGTFMIEQGPDEVCEGASVSGSYPAFLWGELSNVAEWKEGGIPEAGIMGGIQAFPMPSGLGDVRSIDMERDFLKLVEAGKDYEREVTYMCSDGPAYPPREESLVGQPAPFGMVGPKDFRFSPSGAINLEETIAEFPTGYIKVKLSISPPALEYRIHGTVKDAGGKPIPNSKVVMINYEDVKKRQDFQANQTKKLSDLELDFEQETKTSDDEKAEFEFEVISPGEVLPVIIIVSVLWYDSEKAEFAITTGPEENGRKVPVYDIACVDNKPDSTICQQWKPASGGFEAEVDIVYGANPSQPLFNAVDHYSGSFFRQDDAALIYQNSYKAMKYFESIQGAVRMPLDPVIIDIGDTVSDECKDANGNKDNAFFDHDATPTFGGLGTYLERAEAKGGTVTICELTSSRHQEDAPMNREWHELGHYLQSDMYRNSDTLIPGRGTNHAGYLNPSTNDSLVEGFASFVAMLVKEHHEGSEMDPVYPVGDAVYHLEQDYKMWGNNVELFKHDNETIEAKYYPERDSDEEFAVAGILWDLHDGGREVHVSHRVGVNSDLSDLSAGLSRVYPTPTDQVALDGGKIIGNIAAREPLSVADLYSAFRGDVSQADLDMIFISHGAFADTATRDLVHDATETVGSTGSASEPARPSRTKFLPSIPGSYIVADKNGTFAINITHDEPYGNYDFSYQLNMTAGVPAYFVMPPSYYPSRAVFDQISTSDGKVLASNALTIDSDQYWEYIHSIPATGNIFKTIAAVETGSGSPAGTATPTPEDNGSTPPVGDEGGAPPTSGCLIATAAFGSELAPQVQFLRGFRDNHILTTASGSSFMNVFSAWYYSFSPQVADYERQQPWLQGSLRVAIHPLLGILQTAEKAYTVIPGEYGSIAAGLVASSLIGAVYFSPVAIAIRQVRKNRLDYRIAIAIIAALLISIAAALVANNVLALMVATAMLVLSTLSFAAIYSAKAIWKIIRLCRNSG